jgi:hypothetical protein
MIDRVGIGLLRALLVIVMMAMVVASCVSDETAVPIFEARDELLGIVGDVQGATGSRYQLEDDRGHSMDGVKVIQVEETKEFAAVYHWLPDGSEVFTTSLATSANLLDWAWRVDLAEDASQPTIAAASDGGYVLAFEKGVTDTIHVELSLYPTWEDLLAGDSSKHFAAERLLDSCADGTPNIYSASSTEVDFGLAYFWRCEAVRQARGTTDWVTWEAEDQPLLNRAAFLQGYVGSSAGDRDVINFRGHDFTLIEAQFTQDDWGTFRVLLYDEDLGAADKAAFPEPAPKPSSVHALIRTHLGSYSFSNLSVSQVEIDGRQAVVVGVYIQRGAVEEEGPLIYYKILDK